MSVVAKIYCSLELNFIIFPRNKLPFGSKKGDKIKIYNCPGNKSEVWNIELKMAFSDKVKDVLFREFKIRQHLEIFTHNPKNKVYLNKLGL